MAGSTVIAGRFTLLSRAGKGAMGSVYRARDASSGAEVALKILDLEGQQDINRFLREAAVLAHLDHPRIVHYVAHGVTQEDTYFIAEEWVDGITLRAHLHTIGITVAEAVAVAAGVAEALVAAHEAGVVHRDVKPDNVILAAGDPGRVKLVDFGIARAENKLARLTRTGVLIGTPSYMSPEQARGASGVGPAADVWALGCVMYELLTGRMAFPGQSMLAVRAKVLFDDPPRIEALCPEAPPKLVHLTERMMSKDPDFRPSAADVAAAMRACIVEDGPRRRGGQREPATAVMARRGAEPGADLAAFVFYQSCELPGDGDAAAAAPPERSREVAEIASRHNLEAHRLEDGSVILASSRRGAAAAADAARAAIALQAELAPAAVSVVGHRPGDTMAESLELGAAALESGTMQALFADVMPGAGTVSGVPVDDAIASLLDDQFEIEPGPDGFRARARR